VPSSGFLVNLAVVEGLLFEDLECIGLAVELLEEAAVVSGVAGAAGLLDFEEEHVTVAVGEPAFDLLGMAAGFAFAPELPSRSAPIVHQAGLEGFLERFAVHPCEHQDPPGGHATLRGLLNDGRDETIGGKFEIKFHCCRIADCLDNRKRRVKEPEISQVSPPGSVHAPRAPRYRYYSNPPATVSLRLADLAAQIPEASRLPGFNAEHQVELSCEEIFTGPVPKLALSRLAEIANEHVRIDGLPDNPVNLPVARLALAYRFINGRELIEEAPPPEEVKRSEEFAPTALAAESPEGPKPANQAGNALTPPSGAAAGEAKEAVLASPVSSGAAPDAGSAPQPSDAKPLPEAKSGDALSKSSQAPGTQGSSAEAGQESDPAGESKPPEPEVWRPITVFPIFRRKAVEPQVKPPVAPLRPVVEPRASRPPFVPPESSAKAEQDSKAESTERPPVEPSAPPPQAEAVLVATERLPEPKRTVEIVDHDALQAVFMTEERLSVDRVVELCGGLPGIKSCVLAHGAAVIASHNVPESIDLVSLSAHALEMLAAMRQSAARMGVGAVPAVTIHAEKGPITFFHQDDLCLLVMHKDRGFVPGVREKLQQVVEHLAQSTPALAADGSRLAGGSSKPAV
jgi:predicted regulator of Ras-like GTPase activity (Roadblock/LC7/MglB family)